MKNDLGKALMNPFSEKWAEFVQHLGLHNERLLKELTETWHGLRAILDGQAAARARFSIGDLQPGGLASFRQIRGEASRILLYAPMEEVQRIKPYRRSVMAIDSYRHSLESLIGALPARITLSGTLADAAMATAVSNGVMRKWLRRRQRERVLPLKAIVSSELRKISEARIRIERRYLLALVLAQHHLRQPWEITLATIDAAVLERPVLPESRGEAINKDLKNLIRQAETGRCAASRPL